MKRADIEARAREILRDHKMLGAPVNPIALANALGVKVFNAKFGEDNIHGLIARRNGTTSLYVEVDDPPFRKRFTIAHELGHLALHLQNGEGEFIDNADNFRTTFDPEEGWNEKRQKEWEANTFASALLMDAELVRKMWPEIADPEGMAMWFQVSRQAMEIRLETLGIPT